MKKYSKLIAVLLAIAVIICPMMSVVANADSTTPAGDYLLEPVDATHVKLTITSTDGFLVYKAVLNSSVTPSAFTVESYAVKGKSTDQYNRPEVSFNTAGANTTILVSANDSACLDLYTSVVISITIASGASISLTNIQAADQGTVETDATLLDFPGVDVAADGTIDTSDTEIAEKAVVAEAHVHTYVEKGADGILMTPATCTAAAVYYKVCDTCGIKDPSNATYSYGATVPHTFTNYVSDNNATCSANATETATCDVCKAATDTREIPNSKRAHNIVKVAAKAANCTDGGWNEYYKCTYDDCNALFGNADGTVPLSAIPETSATGHSFTKKITQDGYLKTAANCTDDAVYYYACVYCDLTSEGDAGEATYTVADSKLGHSFTDYKSDNNATHFADGTKTATCDNGCGITNTITDTNTKHAVQSTPAKAATCTAPGNIAYNYCETCNKYYNAENTAEIEQSTTVIAINPTAHTGEVGTGSYDANTHWGAYICCGAKANEAGHEFGYTILNNGKHTATCECGYSEEQDCDHNGANNTCSKCGFVWHVHAYTDRFEIIAKPTKDATGTKRCYCECNEYRDETIAVATALDTTFGHSISLASDISVAFTFKTADVNYTNVVDCYGFFEKDLYLGNAVAGNDKTDFDNSKVQYHNTTRNKVVYTGITAKDMSNPIHVVYYFQYKDGSFKYMEENYKLTDYVQGNIDAYSSQFATSAEKRALMRLLCDMLCYGKAAQVNFNYNIDNYATNGFEDYIYQYASNALDDSAFISSAANTDVSNPSFNLAVTLSVGSTIAIQSTIRNSSKKNITDMADLAGYKVKLEYLGKTEYVEPSEVVKIINGACTVYFDKFTTRQAYEVVKITLCDSSNNPVSNTRQYSIASYPTGCRANYPADNLTRVLSESLLTFCLSADDYFSGRY